MDVIEAYISRIRSGATARITLDACVGEKMAGRFDHTGVGESLRFAGRDWSVVCRFTAAGSAFESEIWGENAQLMPVFRGEAFPVVQALLR